MTSANFRLLAIALLFSVSAWADTLALRSGKTLQGTLVGATARQVDFLVDSGKVEHIPIPDIKGITFSAANTPAGSSAAASQSKAPAAKPTITIPAGTALRVRTIDPIDVDVTKAGARFKGSLDDPIMIGGGVVVPRGAEVGLVAAKVQQSGKMKGKDLIQLKLDSIVVKGTRLPLVTSLQEVAGKSEGKSTAKKMLGGAGLGAIVGGIAGGGKGAAIGTLVGGAAGGVISASGEQHLKVPSETRLEFRLESAVKI